VCGKTNSDDGKYCSACGNELPTAPPVKADTNSQMSKSRALFLGLLAGLLFIVPQYFATPTPFHDFLESLLSFSNPYYWATLLSSAHMETVVLLLMGVVAGVVVYLSARWE
jgi:hypothetical protein